MNKPYALQRLLQHGPMRRSELIEVTGWEAWKVDQALYATTCDGRVQEVKARRGRVYQLPPTHFLQNLAGACHE